jgi:hypothetical protein
MYVCMYVCMYICTYIYVCICVCMCVCIYDLRTSVGIAYICIMYAFMLCMNVPRMYLCSIHVCMHSY